MRSIAREQSQRILNMPPILTILPVFKCFTYSQRIKTTVFHFKNSRVSSTLFHRSFKRSQRDILFRPALPQKSDYSRTFEANGISAPKINMTVGWAFSEDRNTTQGNKASPSGKV
jgi:hypothetical protein